MAADSEPAHSSNGSEAPLPRLSARGRAWRLLPLALCGPLTGCSALLGPDAEPSQATTSEASSPLDGLASVEYVIDGDTLDIVIGGQTERVRLIGVDAPESVSRETPDQCFGAEASDALRSLLPEGTEVRLSKDAEARDRYGRLLAYVHRADDDLFVNRWLLDGGYADAVFFEPNTTYRSPFTDARDAAQRAGVGLWAACTGPDQPLDSIGGPADAGGSSPEATR